jgi:hypothetical protein
VSRPARHLIEAYQTKLDEPEEGQGVDARELRKQSLRHQMMENEDLGVLANILLGTMVDA